MGMVTARLGLSATAPQRLLVAAALALAAPVAAMVPSSAADAASVAQLKQITARCDQRYHTHDLDPIRGKVAFFEETSGAVDVEDRLPTEDERQAIAAWADLREQCVREITAALDAGPVPEGDARDTYDWGNSFLTRGMSGVGTLIAQLHDGRLSFAEFARRRSGLVASINSAYHDWRSAMSEQDADRRNDDAEQADRRLNATLLAIANPQPAKAPLTPAVAAKAPSPVPPATATTTPAAAPSPRLSEAPLRLSFPAAPVREDDVAVIIGNADYSRFGKDVPDVVPAHADAESVRLYATSALGIKPANIIFLKDATGAQLTEVFGSKDDPHGQLSDWVKPGRSRVFVYYAGHGAPGANGGQPYLVPVDASADRIGLGGYPLDQLYDNLSKLPAASVTVVFEACFSGQSAAGPLIARASPILIQAKSANIPANLTVISAAASDQMASWERDNSHGLFTEYFLKGLSGEADRAPYGNGDRRVGLDELDRYLKGTVTYFARRYYGRDQSAQISQGGIQLP